MHNSIPTTRKHPRPRSRSRGHRPSRRGSVAEQLATLRLVHEHRAAWLALWLSERACAHRWGQVVRPDRYGRWRQGDREVGFFLEYDCGTEPLDRLAAKLHGYDELVDATEISTLVLFWLPSSGREASVRQALAGEPRWGRVRYPVATASPDLGRSPAEQAWLPLDQTWPRRRLIDLADLDARTPQPAGPID